MSHLHLTRCCDRPLTTADTLLDDIYLDRIPCDGQVREDYGFNRCRDPREESHLLGLYQGIFKHPEMQHVRGTQIDKWRADGELSQKIMNFFSQFPEGSRGGYYPWFLEHRYVLDSSLAISKQPETEAVQLLEGARPYLSSAERNISQPFDIKPREKAECFIFFCLTLDGMNPSPDFFFDMWHKFGFSTSMTDGFEARLGGMYSKLIGGDKMHRDYARSLGVPYKALGPDLGVCPFDDFWQAWNSGSLLKLMTKRGVDPDY